MAGLALAVFEPESPDWEERDAVFLAKILVAADPAEQDALRRHLRPIRKSCRCRRGRDSLPTVPRTRPFGHERRCPDRL